jgi:hypothetical protein
MRLYRGTLYHGTRTVTVQVTPNGSGAHVPGGLARGLSGLLALIVPVRRRDSLQPLCVVMLTGVMFANGCGSQLRPSAGWQPPPISTSTALSVTPTEPILGGATSFSAKVTPMSGTGVPTGTVTFSAGSARLGTSPLTAGSARFTSKLLPLGSQAVIAIYNGDSAYSSSSSEVTMLNVSPPSLLQFLFLTLRPIGEVRKGGHCLLTHSAASRPLEIRSGTAHA